MKRLFSETELNSAKGLDKLPCQCYHCGNTFYALKKEILKVLRGYSKAPKIRYCSRQCSGKAKQNKQLVTCDNCDKRFIKQSRDVRKTKRNFCSHSCRATYGNLNKTYGIRRSKLEQWIEEQIPKHFPDLECHFNHKEAIGSELDLYFPALRLAFEINGLFHYEPIYGAEKLNRIQQLDRSKSLACHSKGIDLCVINTTKQKKFSPKTSQVYLDVIIEVITERKNSMMWSS